MENKMKVKFWFHGSGGHRDEEIIKDIPNWSDSIDIETYLDEWVCSLKSNSEFRRYGWDYYNGEFINSLGKTEVYKNGTLIGAQG